MLKMIATSSFAVMLLAACSHGTPPGHDDSTAPHASTDQFAAKAYLEITLKVDPANRPAAVDVYTKYKKPFLDTVPGAISKQLLVRDEDVVVLHGFDTTAHATDYLKSSLFNNDVVTALKPLLAASPDVRIYAAP
jgi:hypothetical protein